MIRIKKLFLIMLVCTGLLLTLPESASAKTKVVKQDNGNYKIRVQIVFDFKYKLTRPEAERILTDWYKSMNSVWNGINGSTILDHNKSAQYEFVLIKMHQGKVCADYPDWHCVDVVDTLYNERGNRADATLGKPDGSKKSLGQWSKYISPKIAAHEVGHMMGLADEYSYQFANKKGYQNTNYKEKDPQSIMAKTWGYVAAFKEHTLEILQLAGF